MARHADRIKQFWKPDGITPDASREDLLKAWMRSNGLSMQPGAITALIHSPVLQSARAAAVKALLPAAAPRRSAR